MISNQSVFGACTAIAGLVVGLWTGPVAAQTRTAPRAAGSGGRVRCSVSDNGRAATARAEIRKGDSLVTAASCATGISVPPGDYTLVVELDGALDRPQQRKELRVVSGGTVEASFAFETANLEIRIEREGKRAAGLTTVLDASGKTIGTLGVGARGRLSVGRYKLVVRCREDQKSIDNLVLSRGEQRLVEVSF